MDNKIQELTNKLLSEGVEKGKAEAAQIVADAETQALAIIADAKKQAEEIRSAALKESHAMSENTKSELKMFAGQALNALKSEVANVISDSVVNQLVGNLVTDKDFMNSFILNLAKSWGANENIVISAEDASGLKAYFAKGAKELLDKGVEIREVHGQDVAFSVQPADGSYKVNFGEKEFENFFKSFLRPQLVEMLF